MTPARAGVAEGGGELCRAGRRLQADRSIAAAAGCSREGEAAGRAPEDKFVLKRNVFSSYFHCVYEDSYYGSLTDLNDPRDFTLYRSTTIFHF